jgi:hypothetical protein
MINGQVLFTDSDCPTGSKASSITVNTANVGTVAPKRLETITPRNQDQSAVMNAPSASTVKTALARNTECGYLEEQIQLIDSLARQPQSAQTQDNLSAQRKKLRSRQHELPC